MSILLEYCQDMEPLTEAFYGKPRQFVEIEKRLAKIIDMIAVTIENPSDAVDINSMKELKEIEDIFTKFFGNDETSITFYSPVLLPGRNAFTVPSSLAFFRKDKNNKRLTRPSDLYINVNVDMGLVYYLKLTPQELMGVILHEIGHCFDASFFMFLQKINLRLLPEFNGMKLTNTTTTEKVVNSAMSTFTSFVMGLTPVSKAYQALNRFVSQNPFLNQMVEIISNLMTDVATFFTYLQRFNILKDLFKNPTVVIARFINPPNLFGYASEKFADSFATSYGYGKEMSSFLYKFQENKGLEMNEAMTKFPVLNIGYDFAKISGQAATFMLDPHPDNHIRIQSQLNKLKRDLRDPNLDPKIRKELEANIEDIEKFIDETVLNSEERKEKGQIFSYIWAYTLMKVFKGKLDIREIFEAFWNHEM